MRPPVPIAIFIQSFHPGGTERQTIELIRRLDRKAFQVHVACFHREGAWLPHAEELAASVAEFPIRGFRRVSTLAQARAFAGWCRQADIKAVYTADLYANVFALPAAALAGVPVRIGSRREINASKSTGQIALQRAAYTWAHRVIANCVAAADRLRRERVPASSIRIVTNGLDASRYAPRNDRSVRRVVTVANLRPEKAHEVLLEAASLVLHRRPEIEFLIAGDGPRRRELEALAQRLGISRQVTFLGHCEDVPGLLAEADLFVLTSRSEAFPNSVLEAMAAGLPIVATGVGGIRELLEHQRTGVLVPPDDPRSLSYALLDLIHWDTHAAELGRAARQTVRTRYSFDRMVAGFEGIFRDELAKHASGVPITTEVVAS